MFGGLGGFVGSGGKGAPLRAVRERGVASSQRDELIHELEEQCPSILQVPHIIFAHTHTRHTYTHTYTQRMHDNCWNMFACPTIENMFECPTERALFHARARHTLRT